MKKILSIVIIVALIATLFGCTSTEQPAASTAPEVSSTPEQESASTEEAAQDKEIVIGYLGKNMAIQWIQDMETAGKKLSEEYNFKFISADAQASAETQMSQLETFISQDVDGVFTLIADVGSAPALAARCEEAGIPLIGDSLRLTDDQGNFVAPAVELYSYECGNMAAQWVVDNHKNIGFDFGDFSDVAFCTIDNSTQPNAGLRCDGADDAWLKAFPDFPKNQILRADVAADSGEGTDAAFNQLKGLITANPDKKTWIIIPAVEDYGVGAARAMEDAGLEDTTIIVGIGGERAVGEWETGLTKCWYASVYYEAEDCARMIVEGLLDVIKNGKKLEDLYPEFKEEGQKYAAAKFTGRLVTPENYKEFIK